MARTATSRGLPGAARRLWAFRRNSSAMAIAEIAVSTLVTVVIFRLIVSHASLAMLGVWSLTQSFTAIVRIADVGVSGALSRYIGAVPDGDRRMVWRYVDSALVFTLLFYLLLVAAAYYPLRLALHHSLPPAEESVALQLLPFILANLVVAAVQSVPANALVGLRRGSTKSLATIASMVLWLALSALLLPTWGIVGLAAAQLAQSGLNLLLCWLILSSSLGQRLRLGIRPELAVVRSTLGFSLSMQLVTILSQLYEVVLRFTLSRYGGAASVGLYEVADRFIRVARQILLMPSLLAVPVYARAFARGQIRAVRRLYQRQFRLNAVAAVALFCGVLVVSPLVSLFVIGHLDQAYLAFLAIVWAASLMNVLAVPAYLLGAGSGELRFNLLGNFIGVAGTAIFSTIGGMLFGAIGALAGGGMMLAAGSATILLFNTRRFGVGILPSFRGLGRVHRAATWRTLFAPVLS